MDEKNELLLNFILELRRGTLVLSVLSRMAEPKYGYALVQSLEKEGMRIDANTLYPLLRRLEKQGLLESVWETGVPSHASIIGGRRLVKRSTPHCVNNGIR